MKSTTNKKETKKTVSVESLQQFKELYFPKMTSNEKLLGARMEEVYGDSIAMTILDGIKKDLTSLRK